ncbi:MAG: hypothetical protein ACI3VX_05105 [Faecousia sp.]
MIELQRQILCVLLDTLLDRGLIGQSVYDAARRKVNDCTELPAFFQVCTQQADGHGAS